MSSGTDAVDLGWAHPVVKHVPDQQMLFDGITISSPEAWLITAGEYADEGEPDLIVSVGYAVDAEGNDIGERLAGVIRDALTAFAAGDYRQENRS